MRVIGFAGWSGAGKTTLLRRVIPLLVARGLHVSTVKHAHHRFDVDQPGKDSWEHRQAGATEVLVASDTRWALMHELRGAEEPDLPWLLARMTQVDLVLVEGFKRDRHAKIEVFRAGAGRQPLHPEDQSIVAVASDTPFPGARVPVLRLDDTAGIADAALTHAVPLERIAWRAAPASRPSPARREGEVLSSSDPAA
jgi:molybdopterin-guanine dinucleotide biosynthesis adapter protein